jgi:L-seryl-tRNA(Ser) seleniumtransferase
MSPSTSTRPAGQPSTFETLGVRRVINCKGTYTAISGSRLVPQAAQAMAAASDAYVAMDELLERVGERLAALTGAEWGLITCGCAAALTDVTAACMAGADPERMALLPDTTGMPDEVIIQKAHRNSYDRAIELAGARLVQVETAAEYLQAFSARTALVAIIGDYEESSNFPIPWMIARAHERGVPCLVDAAAQRPDIPNRYLAVGADVVLYSGGKCLRGPQASGLALGRKDLLQAAFLNGAPHHGVGRPMKMGKEEVMGLLGAVEAWLLYRDHDAEWRTWEGYLAEIRQAVADLPSVQTRVEQPGLANHAPTLLIEWDAAVLGCTPADTHAELWAGDPRLALHLEPCGLRIMPYMMEAGDATIAARRLREVLSQPQPPPAPDDPPACDLSGDWQVTLQFTLGAAQHAVRWQQAGSALAGEYVTAYNRVPVAGTVTGRGVSFQATLGRSSNLTVYCFTGVLVGEELVGQVSLGEYWQAAWRAARCAVADVPSL